MPKFDPSINYYDVLGIDETASQDEIRRKYRELAKEHHPDVNPDDAAAEERFKNMNSAYEVLSNASTRSQYDQSRKGGNVGGNPFGGGGFGFHPGVMQQQNTSIPQSIIITPVETLNDIHRTVTYQRNIYCHECKGQGGVAQPIQCNDCNGTGQLQKHTEINGMLFTHVLGTCPRCRGRGMRYAIVCDKCSGFGFTTETCTQNVVIKRGTLFQQNGVRGAGNYEYPNLPPGDLILRIQIDCGENMSLIQGGVLVHKYHVDPVQAMLGDEIKVATIDGTEVTCKLPMGCEYGKEFRFDGLGIEVHPAQRGPYVVQIHFDMPQNLNQEQAVALRAYLAAKTVISTVDGDQQEKNYATTEEN